MFLLTTLTLALQSPVFDGSYLVNMKIGDRLFHDRMELKGASGPISPFGRQQVTGEFTVPDVFTSALTGRIHCHPWNFSCQLTFDITAVERGSEFKVSFHGGIDAEHFQRFLEGAQPVFTGKAVLEEGGELGTFEAIRQP